MKKKCADRFFLGIVATLTFVGFIIFTSASLGLLARDGAMFSSVALRQFFLGIILGSIALVIVSKINYRVWKKYSLYIFIFSLALTALVFVPSLGLTHGGATRWIDLGIITFQPTEFLKLGFVIYFAALLSSLRTRIQSLKYGIIPLGIVLVVTCLPLVKQPDFGAVLIISITALSMFVAAKGRWKHFAGILVTLLLLATIATFTQPHVMDRVLTFVNPERDPLGAGYQIRQSLITIGSGEMFGRGFGQSIQKFEYLPEPTGDSIFAVAAEEFGFIGAVILILLFLMFAFRGFVIAQNAPTRFSGLLVFGIVILVISQSFINIAAMLGIAPLTGMPLLFVSQGGTALFFVLLSVGIILSISRHSKKQLKTI